mgnify:CR=1 FL=1
MICEIFADASFGIPVPCINNFWEAFLGMFFLFTGGYFFLNYHSTFIRAYDLKFCSEKNHDPDAGDKKRYKVMLPIVSISIGFAFLATLLFYFLQTGKNDKTNDLLVLLTFLIMILGPVLVLIFNNLKQTISGIESLKSREGELYAKQENQCVIQKNLSKQQDAIFLFQYAQEGEVKYQAYLSRLTIKNEGNPKNQEILRKEIDAISNAIEIFIAVKNDRLSSLIWFTEGVGSENFYIGRLKDFEQRNEKLLERFLSQLLKTKEISARLSEEEVASENMERSINHEEENAIRGLLRILQL